MQDARLQTITQILELTHSLVDRKESDKEWQKCKACDDTSVGSLLAKLRTTYPMALWPKCPVDIASRYPGPVHELIWKLQSMKCDNYARPWYETCGFVTRLKVGIERILEEDMPSGMNESHRRHMATQRLKLDQSYSLLGQLS